MRNSIFEIKDDFYLNGKKIKIISGGIHYFRVVPEYWRDRLEKLKAMGCNTVETYVAWNLHEPKKGTFNFNGILNLKVFIELAAEIGLWVIVRPSPYICAEWEFGGLPAWLIADDNMKLRCNYDPYINHIKDYYKELFKILTPLQINYGGPIILMQIENEYGYFGDDKEYLNNLKNIMIENGAVVPFVTSDGPWGDALECGKVGKDVLSNANFGSKAEEQFNILSNYTEGGPLMCMEFWVGWFDSWGIKEHRKSNLEENIKDLDEILKRGHVNIYMFHGGTNFGFMNGSNYYDELTPDVTSYDYDAVITECGDLTPKYHEFKKVISQYNSVEPFEFSNNIKKCEYGKIEVSNKVSLFSVIDDISKPIFDINTLSMEKLGQNYGYIMYKSNISNTDSVEKFKLLGANDRANIYINEEHMITRYDKELEEECSFMINNKKENTIEILVENMGRVNFGPKLNKQRKGIDDGVIINGHYHFGWNHYSLPLDNLEKIDFSKKYKKGSPAFYKFKFEVNEIGDTFLDFSKWGKGCIFVNGFNIGRFWGIGPQKRLYIPGPILKIGINEIIIFETEGKVSSSITLCKDALLD